jgi:hypothetical protein
MCMTTRAPVLRSPVIALARRFTRPSRAHSGLRLALRRKKVTDDEDKDECLCTLVFVTSGLRQQLFVCG